VEESGGKEEDSGYGGAVGVIYVLNLIYDYLFIIEGVGGDGGG